MRCAYPPRQEGVSMNLTAVSYWQGAENHSALLLQHYRYRKVPFCFLALCAGGNESQGRAGAYLTGQLLRWFRGLPFRRLARDPERSISVLERDMKSRLGRLDEELEAGGLTRGKNRQPVSGIFCVDDCFLLFSRGGQKIFLLNRDMGRGSVRCLSDVTEKGTSAADLPGMRQGILQRDVGILLATDTFCRFLADSDIRECLYVDELEDESRIRRRLYELGQRCETLGGRDMAAGIVLSGP